MTMMMTYCSSMMRWNRHDETLCRSAKKIPYDDDESVVSTALVLVTAIPICFPFVMAAFLNCHGAGTVSRLLALCRAHTHQWTSAHRVRATVEHVQATSATDEVIDKLVIQLEPLPSSKELSVELGAPQEASPEATKR